jgi:hypothetical protein
VNLRWLVSRAVLDRVAEQVLKYLLQLSRIGADTWQSLVGGNDHAAFNDRCTQVRLRTSQYVFDADFVDELQGSIVGCHDGTRVGEKAIHQFCHTLT